jgi:hypothetical protein
MIGGMLGELLIDLAAAVLSSVGRDFWGWLFGPRA